MKLLTFDPGESTGWATFEIGEPGSPYKLLDSGTCDMTEVGPALWRAIVGPVALAYDTELAGTWEGAGHVAFEDWVIYPHKAMDLIGDYCRTARLIGRIELACQAGGVPYTAQLARNAKSPAEQAGAEDLFAYPLHENRHANDAIRHGVYFELMRTFRARKASPAKS